MSNISVAAYKANMVPATLKPISILSFQRKPDYTLRLELRLAGGLRISRANATGFDKWHVFAVLAHRQNRTTGIMEYKVHWEGYPKKDFTWEDALDFESWSPDLKREYDQLHGLA
ncbi:hypothetical protein FIE12Z_7271 [Fusarium flagelliforme]|uniref:Chromo domain-containing protein n=1 Tax=Fusarium flagelliforme TaxID=2675880 RepID=A0A395MKI6_9HYPO|nr:hypothetical protein FIE12Z_7271 [Fusarium flagelliforme]